VVGQRVGLGERSELGIEPGGPVELVDDIGTRHVDLGDDDGSALAGEVFAGRPGTGAAAGALIGAATGAYAGCSRAGTCWGRARDQGRRRYDPRYDRYYYDDPRFGDTYWDDGSFRRYGRRPQPRRW